MPTPLTPLTPFTRPTPSRLSLAALLAAAVLLGACASTAPVVYSKKHDRVETSARTQADIAQCSQAADARVGRNGLNTETVTRQSASTAGVGFVAAAVGGVVSRSKGVWERARGAAAGGASGMATKLLLEWNEGDEVFQNHVERCLQARGHEVLGWR